MRPWLSIAALTLAGAPASAGAQYNPFAAFPAPAPAAPAAIFAAGQTVIASPTQTETGWQRCEVKSGPDASGYYRADCVDEFRATDGLRKTVREVGINPRWIKADDPSFRPDMTLQAGRVADLAQQVLAAAAAKPAAGAPMPAAPPAAPAPTGQRPTQGPAGAVATGDYLCWGNGQARLLLNFTVTGMGTYRASDGSTGRFTYNPANGAVVFTGYLAEVLPEGFTTAYRVDNGVPTVDFNSARGVQSSFCERL